MSMRLDLKCAMFISATTFNLILANAGYVAAAEPTALSANNGERLIVPFDWKIEHRQRSPADILVSQMGTAEGRAVLAAAATALGMDPSTAVAVAEVIPLPRIDAGATDNKGVIKPPQGMTICKAGQIGKLEASRAAWSATIVRDAKRDGLSYYTSVGTDPHNTHRIQGRFFIEFVKPVPGWEQKFGCSPHGTRVWNIKDQIK